MNKKIDTLFSVTKLTNHKHCIYFYVLFLSIGNAYETLKDASKRRTYDLQTERPASAHPQQTSSNTRGSQSTGTNGHTFFTSSTNNDRSKSSNAGAKSHFSFSGMLSLCTMYLIYLIYQSL